MPSTAIEIHPPFSGFSHKVLGEIREQSTPSGGTQNKIQGGDIFGKRGEGTGRGYTF